MSALQIGGTTGCCRRGGECNRLTIPDVYQTHLCREVYMQLVVPPLAIPVPRQDNDTSNQDRTAFIIKLTRL